MRRHSLLLCVSLAFAGGIVLDAQWIKLPTPGLPRTPDGKPHLTAPAPRTADGKPDLSGVWKNDGGDRYNNNIAAELQVSDVAPWAHALFVKRTREFSKDSMETQCLPLGQEGTNLWFDYDGKGKELLIPESPTRFSWAGTVVEFSTAASGAMNILIRSVEGDERGVRRK